MNECVIVIPCYNEARRLDVDAFVRFAAAGYACRFLLVNDGSTDDTGDVLARLARCDPQHFQIHELQANVGKAEAVRRGVLRALQDEPEYIGFWDADLATPLEAIPQFYDQLQQHPQLQLVLGARVKLLGRSIERRPLRHYLGRVFATAASLTLRLAVYDTQCGAKMFRNSALTRPLFDEPFQTRWIFDVELLARFIREAQRQAVSLERTLYELPLSRWHDVPGSKLKTADFFWALLGLVRIYWTCLRGAGGLPRARGSAVPAQPAGGSRGTSEAGAILRSYDSD